MTSENLLFNDLLSFESSNVSSFDYLKLKIATEKDILSWSYGEVKKPDTINYRTFKPERDGLFCAKIFGPIKDYECLCGKYKRIKYKGIKCEKCDVEVTLASVRRERMGHIQLCSSVVNPLFLKSGNGQSIIGILLSLTSIQVESIVFFSSYVVTDAGNTTLDVKTILNQDEYNDALDKFGYDTFNVLSGPDAVKYLLVNLNLEEELNKVKIALDSTNSAYAKKQLSRKRLLIKNLISSGNKPESVVMNVVPVLPPDLRPIVMLDGGKCASSDLNDLYRLVINRNNRLKRLISLCAPDLIINNERRMLQEAVFALFNNSKMSRPVKDQAGRALKSLSDGLKGKGGRFRQNLLGKRVDYSGRSVIVVGPNLKLHECGLPKLMAIELFKPFIISRLRATGKAATIKSAVDLIDSYSPVAFDCLEEVIKEHPILLNRAPTLHRLGIQAFEALLVDSKSIQLHPLVCRAFNADFDGDQMAVHIPLSIESQTEARVLMMSSNNILNPANGDPMIVPKKDIAAGIYYLTFKNADFTGKKKAFSCYEDVASALANNIVKTHDAIDYYYNFAGEQKNIETTPGLVKIFNLIPSDCGIDYEEFNKPLSVSIISELVARINEESGKKAAVLFCDKAMYLGFEYSTISGLSFGMDDMVIPDSKKRHIADAMKIIEETTEQYNTGYITYKEKYNRITDEWSTCTTKISNDMMNDIKKNSTNPYSMNAVNIIMNSGARASVAQMRQLGGMRGLISKTNGEILETPIISNFKEGLDIFEYFNSAHGSRKGSVDTALKTADAGYLTRRLVDVAQDCIVYEEDCHATEGILYKAKVINGEIVESVYKNTLNRVVLNDVVHGTEVIIKAGELITKKHKKIIDQYNVKEIVVRSPVTCRSKFGICAKCYGSDLATGDMVSVGEAVGIVAAQSMGEPGTQLTMNTFHVSGATSKNIVDTQIRTGFDGKVSFVDIDFIETDAKTNITLTPFGKIEILDKNDICIYSYDVEYGSVLKVSDGEKIKKGDCLFEIDPYNNLIFADVDGYISFEDFVSNVSLKERVDETSGKVVKIISDWTKISKELTPKIIILDKAGSKIKDKNGFDIFYNLPVGAMLVIESGEFVKRGSVLAKIPRDFSSGMKDITGGLPMVEAVFEARSIKNPAFICPFDGYIQFEPDVRIKTKVTINPVDKSFEPYTFTVNKNRHISLRHGSFVKKGHVILSGEIDISNMLNVISVSDAVTYIVDKIQSIYGLQGVFISAKHIEVVAKFMLEKCVVKDPGDSNFSFGETTAISKVLAANEILKAEGGALIKFEKILQSITKASLGTDSFISAASFQETIRILTESALSAKKDNLIGMKENIIVGRLIPAGTGLSVEKMKLRK